MIKLMDFRLKGKANQVWNNDGLKRILDELGVKTLQDAIEKGREKVRANGFKPIEPPVISSGGFISVDRADAIASNAETIRNLSLPDNDRFKYAPPYSQPRLPYKDDSE